MDAHLKFNNTIIYPVPCACSWHQFERPDFQRPIDMGHVGRIQNALLKHRDHSGSVIKTITIVNDAHQNKLYILDGQHRYMAVQNECKKENHIPFAVQLVPGDYDLAYELYKMETGALPHDRQVQATTKPEETQFLYQAKAYLKGLDMKFDGVKRPTVNIDALFQAYMNTRRPQTMAAFRAWVEDQNTKIKEAIARLPEPTKAGPKLAKTTLALCQKYKYWFGLYSSNQYDQINELP
jgi:hypothetical protein